jgi:hypothetical protein
MVLGSSGVFRLVLPDLEVLVARYVTDGSDDSAVRFIEYSGLGKTQRPRSISSFLREFLGGSQHLWLWDFKSLRSELAAAGFTGIRRASFHDSAYEPFRLVEEEGRWRDALGIECFAPR